MKKLTLISALVMSSLATAYGQDIPQSQVPSLVVTNFQQAFSKAADIEWEMEGELYKAEFEIGMFGPDHKAWYEGSGKLVKHQEEISKTDLPENVLATAKREFDGFAIDDVKKITAGNAVTYILELQKLSEEWKVVIDAAGKVVSKVAD